ncbi:unnamed protein product [Calypogeia fissa]
MTPGRTQFLAAAALWYWGGVAPTADQHGTLAFAGGEHRVPNKVTDDREWPVESPAANRAPNGASGTQPSFCTPHGIGWNLSQRFSSGPSIPYIGGQKPSVRIDGL